MKTTYTPFPAADGVACDECGEPATIVLEADQRDPQTGYVDERRLCNDCATVEYERSHRAESVWE